MFDTSELAPRPNSLLVSWCSRADNVPMGLYVIQYRYPSDRKFLVEDFRPLHRTHMRDLQAKGLLVASGFLSDAVFDGALIILRADSAQEAEVLLEGDAFYDSGLMEELVIRSWSPTLGPDAPDFDTEFPTS